MRKNIIKNMEWKILICALVLSTIGLFALYSATISTGLDEFKKQIMWLIVSIIIMIVVINIDYETLLKISPILYGISIILLIAVLFTKRINGSTAWFSFGAFSFQPSEFAKISVILFLTYVINRIQKKGKNEINRPLKLLLLFAVVSIPMLLLVKEPDYGMCAVYVVATVSILFVAGLDKKYIITSIALVVVLIPVTYNFILPKYAKTRIDVFLNPDLDPKGSGYNIIQSKLAIGAGELTGMGIANGNQTQLGYLYPKTTDFIFSVIGEEMGFIIAALVIIANVVLITKAIYIAKTSKDDEGAYIAAGIVGIFLFHLLENVGMTMGIMPITGVPLLFVSYGGSSLISSFICIGLLLNISGRRQKTIFSR